MSERLPQRAPMGAPLGDTEDRLFEVLVALEKNQKQHEVAPEVLRH
jgi:hypothetical protein